MEQISNTQDSQNDIYGFIMSNLQQGLSPEDVVSQLVNMGVDQTQASEAVNSVLQQSTQMKYGGKPSKKDFYKNMLKMQNGGNSSLDMDKSDESKNSFLDVIKRSSEEAIFKQQVDAMYDQMYSDDVYSDDIYDELPEARLGRFFRNRRQPQIPINPALLSQMSNISKIDVRKTGLFGRPKRYSIEFNNYPQEVPSDKFSGLPGGANNPNSNPEAAKAVIEEEIKKSEQNSADNNTNTSNNTPDGTGKTSTENTKPKPKVDPVIDNNSNKNNSGLNIDPYYEYVSKLSDKFSDMYGNTPTSNELTSGSGIGGDKGLQNPKYKSKKQNSTKTKLVFKKKLLVGQPYTIPNNESGWEYFPNEDGTIRAVNKKSGEDKLIEDPDRLNQLNEQLFIKPNVYYKTGGELPQYFKGGLKKYKGDEEGSIVNNNLTTDYFSQITNPLNVFTGSKGSYTKQLGRPYQGDLSNAPISKIDVKRSRLDGTPKRYNITYRIPKQYQDQEELKPITLNENQVSNSEGISSFKDKMLRVPGLNKLVAKTIPFETQGNTGTGDPVYDNLSLNEQLQADQWAREQDAIYKRNQYIDPNSGIDRSSIEMPSPPVVEPEVFNNYNSQNNQNQITNTQRVNNSLENSVTSNFLNTSDKRLPKSSILNSNIFDIEVVQDMIESENFKNKEELRTQQFQDYFNNLDNPNLNSDNADYNQYIENPNLTDRQNFDYNKMLEQDNIYFDRLPYNADVLGRLRQQAEFDQPQNTFVENVEEELDNPVKRLFRKKQNKKQKFNTTNSNQQVINNQVINSKLKNNTNQLNNNKNTVENQKPVNRFYNGLGEHPGLKDKISLELGKQRNKELKNNISLQNKDLQAYIQEYGDRKVAVIKYNEDNPNNPIEMQFEDGTSASDYKKFKKYGGLNKYNPGGIIVDEEESVFGPQGAFSTQWTNPPVNPYEQAQEYIQQDNPLEYEDLTLRYKNKRPINYNRAMDLTNMGLNAASFIGENFEAGQNQLRALDNLTADNLYTANYRRNRGDYDTNSGLFRPSRMGQMYAQYGGFIEDDEVDMTEEEIEEFLRNGGEIEFL